jgi:hypothetical protein
MVSMIVLLVVLVTVLCPLAIIYVFGILISGGISLWRLKEHDYRGYANSGSDGESSNLPGAMDTLHCLVLIQVVLFCYRFMLGRMGKRLAHAFASSDNDLEKQVFSSYLLETKKGCEKDPSFAKGRNLLKHAIDMISSKSYIDCISGMEILYTRICIVERHLKDLVRWGAKEDNVARERMRMKHLVGVASSSRKILQKLLEMLDSEGLHDRATRNQAAKIVECLAPNINLEQFPRGIHYISSLIGTLQEYSLAQPRQQEWDSPGGDGTASAKFVQAYKELLLHGLCIIRELSSNENNCRVISDTQELVSRIMAPVTSDLLNHTSDDHGEWSNIVDISLEVMSRLSGAPGETGARLRREISIDVEAVRTIWRILRCTKCDDQLKRRAIQILTILYMDNESREDFVILGKESREDFVRMLVDTFTKDCMYSISMSEYAGGALLEVCFRGRISDATIIIQTNGGDIVDSITKVLVHGENDTCRQAAAEILKHLCTHYTNDDEYLRKLKKSILKVVNHCQTVVISKTRFKLQK